MAHRNVSDDGKVAPYLHALAKLAKKKDVTAKYLTEQYASNGHSTSVELSALACPYHTSIMRYIF